MRHPTDKPSEPIMRFFTPELYTQFNSPDDDLADRANEAWEKALQDYQRHLDAIRHRMPSQVRKVAELCPHDAEVLGFEQHLQSFFPFPEPFWPIPLWSAVAILALKQDGTILSLIYMLWDRIREYSATEDWQFSKLRKHWLYDEVDVVADHRGMFLHRILFSDGSVVEIPFVSVITSTVTLPVTEEGGVARRIA
jgi:hypothetical protein